MTRVADRLRQAYLVVAIPVTVIADGIIYDVVDWWRFRKRSRRMPVADEPDEEPRSESSYTSDDIV